MGDQSLQTILVCL